MKKQVKPRFTNFGNGPISDYHRHEFGYDMPAVELDWPVVEYTEADPAALIEYKHFNFGACGQKLDPYSPSIVALRKFCAPREYEIPFFVVKYAHDFKTWMVYPMNHEGRATIGDKYAILTEPQYHNFLKDLRDRQKQRRAS